MDKILEYFKAILGGWNDIEQMGVVCIEDKDEFGLLFNADMIDDEQVFSTGHYLYCYINRMYGNDGCLTEDLTLKNSNGEYIYLYKITFNE